MSIAPSLPDLSVGNGNLPRPEPQHSQCALTTIPTPSVSNMLGNRMLFGGN